MLIWLAAVAREAAPAPQSRRPLKVCGVRTQRLASFRSRWCRLSSELPWRWGEQCISTDCEHSADRQGAYITPRRPRAARRLLAGRRGRHRPPTAHRPPAPLRYLIYRTRRLKGKSVKRLPFLFPSPPSPSSSSLNTMQMCWYNVDLHTNLIHLQPQVHGKTWKDMRDEEKGKWSNCKSVAGKREVCCVRTGTKDEKQGREEALWLSSLVSVSTMCLNMVGNMVGTTNYENTMESESRFCVNVEDRGLQQCL